MAVASPGLVTVKVVKYPGGLACALYLNEVFGESSFFKIYFGTSLVIRIYPVGVDSHTLHYHLFKAQVMKESRRAIAQRWTTTPERERNVLKIAIALC